MILNPAPTRSTDSPIFFTFKPWNDPLVSAIASGTNVPTTSVGDYLTAADGVHFSQLPHGSAELSKSDDPWVPSRVEKAKDVVWIKTDEEEITETLMKKITSFLNKLNLSNYNVIIQEFNLLRIVISVDRLEKIVDLIMKRAIEDQRYSPLYVSLCLYLQYVTVFGKNNTILDTFRKIVIRRCDELYKLNETREADTAAKLAEIEACYDPIIKEKLLQQYKAYQAKLFKTNKSPWVFSEFGIGLVKTRNNNADDNDEDYYYLLAVLLDLLYNYVEDPFIYIYNQLKHFKKILDQNVDINNVYRKIENVLACQKSLPWRVRFMMMELLELRKNNWKERRFPGMNPTPNTTDYLLCHNIVREYVTLGNIDDIIYILVEDKNCTFRIRHRDFIFEIFQVCLEYSPYVLEKMAGTLIEALAREAMDVMELNHGIKKILKYYNIYLKEFPHYFYYVNELFFHLFTTKAFDYNFTHFHKAMAEENAGIVFINLLYKLFHRDVDSNNPYNNGSAFHIFSKWRRQKDISVVAYTINMDLNNYFTNDSFGTFFLTLFMYDKMRWISGSKFIISLIRTTIQECIIARDTFVKAVTMAAVYISIIEPHEFLKNHLNLVVECIHWPLPNVDYVEREIQFLKTIQLMMAMFGPEHADTVYQSFHKIFITGAISETAYQKWKDDSDEVADENEYFARRTIMSLVANTFGEL